MTLIFVYRSFNHCVTFVVRDRGLVRKLIGNGLWGIEWSRDRLCQVTQAERETRDHNTLRVQYLENGWRFNYTRDEKLLCLKGHFTFYCKIYRAASAFNCTQLHQFIYIYVHNTQSYGRSKRQSQFLKFSERQHHKNVKMLSTVDIDKHNSSIMPNNGLLHKVFALSTTSFNTCL